MSLLTQQDLLDFFGLSASQLPSNWQAQLDLAETDCSEFLGSQPFTKATVSVSGYEILEYTETLLVEQGLLTGITSATLDGIDIAADLETTWWEITYPDRFSRGGLLDLVYTVGWDTSAEMDKPLYYGILQTYESHGNYRGAGVQSERIGDYAVAYTSAATRSMPTPVRNSIVQYRRPRFEEAERYTIR